MPGAQSVAVVEDPRYREHRGPPGHPERPERLVAVGAAIARQRAALAPIAVRPAHDAELLRIHAPEHLLRIARAGARAPARLDPDTFVCPESERVARLAAGGAIDLTLAVASGRARAGLAAVRPPGHHAEADRAMGFCLFNNAALAARAAQAELGVGKVLIIDWDVHHGNGTQRSFESDPSVLYFSTHQFPYYPGTGDFGEIGVGRGEGATVNVPLPAGCGDPEYAAVFEWILAPVARAFQARADRPVRGLRRAPRRSAGGDGGERGGLSGNERAGARARRRALRGAHRLRARGRLLGERTRGGHQRPARRAGPRARAGAPHAPPPRAWIARREPARPGPRRPCESVFRHRPALEGREFPC